MHGWSMDARRRDLGFHGARGESETAVGSVDEMQVPRVLQAKQQTGYQRRSRRVHAIDDVASPVRGARGSPRWRAAGPACSRVPAEAHHRTGDSPSWPANPAITGA